MEKQTVDIAAIATQALNILGTGKQIALFSSRYPELGLDDAWRVTALARQMRASRGERPIGRKIGFTNRTIWAEYGVYAPIWGYLFDRTVHDLGEIGGRFSLAGLAEPRIEPEIVFGLAAAPTPGMDEHALLSCIDWVAHGFEIVQSIYRGWKFTAADTIIANGLHGALLVGERHPVTPHAAEWARTLSTFEIDLLQNGSLADHGRAADVLDGPLSALRHLVELLASDICNPPLAAGEIITTGTLTRALPVAAGETWSTALAGVAIGGISARFEG